MLNFPLLNFILYNFLQAHIKSVVIFNCWPLKTQKAFHQLTAENNLYTQFIDADKYNATEDIEYRFFRHDHPTLGIFLDMRCKTTVPMLHICSRLRLFSEHYHWLLYDQQANVTNFRRLFVNANLSVDADLTYAILNTKRIIHAQQASYMLYDVYNNGYQLGGKLNMTLDREISCDMSTCQVAKYLSKLHLRPKYGNRETLSDITMRVSTVITKRSLSLPESELQEFLHSINTSHVDSLVRYGFNLILLKKDVFKCNLTFHYTDHWSDTETHGGSVGDVISETADLVSTPFLVLASRLKYVSVLAETGGFRSICIFRTPLNSGIQGGVFLEPFSTAVWLIFGVILAIAALLLWSTFRVEQTRMRYYWQCMPSFLSTCLISFGSACYQGSYLIPSSVGGRIAFFTLSLISFIMYNYYTSIVVSSLLGSPIKSNIKTLGQLADSSLEVALEPLPFTFVYLNVSQLPDVRRFVKRKIESKKNRDSVWIPVEEGVKKVRDNPGFVFVFEASTGYAFIEKYYKPHEICDLNEILLRSDKTLHTQVHKNSSYKEYIRLKETRMLETGIIQKHRRYWVREGLTCFSSNYVITVGMEYAAPLFFMLLCSYLLVMLLLIIEILWHRKYEHKL